MAEWTDIAGLEWTDLASPEWEGDLSVAVPDCPGLTAASQVAGVQVDCIQNVTGALTILAATKEASIQTDVTVEPAALSLVVTSQEPESVSISPSIVMTAPIAMTAAMKEATVQSVSMAALEAPIAVALTPKEPALVSGSTVVTVGSALSLSVTPKAASFRHDSRVVMGQVIPIRATAKDPSFIISPSVSVSAPLVMSLAVLEHGTQFNQDVELASPPALALAAKEPQSVNLSSSPPSDVISVTITVMDATVSIDVSPEVEAPLSVQVTVKGPTYFGPPQAEALIINSYITTEKVIESDIDIRMYAYG